MPDSCGPVKERIAGLRKIILHYGADGKNRFPVRANAGLCLGLL